MVIFDYIILIINGNGVLLLQLKLCNDLFVYYLIEFLQVVVLEKYLLESLIIRNYVGCLIS